MDASTQHILIAGGNGFLGLSLAHYFLAKGCEIKILSRSKKDDQPGITFIQWDGEHIGEWTAAVDWADILINMSGKSVDCRYNEQNKKLIYDSRINSTRILCEAISLAENPPKLWINSSSASTYIHSESQQMTEDEGIIGDDFSMNICKSWEAEFFKCNLNQTRRVATRTSIVLGNNGGAYPIMKRLVKYGLGGKQGNGRQFISWIHIHDFCRAIDFIIHHPELVGPVNVTSPQPVRNKDFMKGMQKRYRKSIAISQAKWILELGAALIGTETEMVLKSRNVIPERLLESGFEFEYKELSAALKHLD